MKKIRVLVVDDSRTACEMLEEILRTDGRFEVVGTAGNGQEALERNAALRPDVVTMDIHMPLLDGFEATRRIMMSEPVPIVIVSASSDSGSVEKSMEALSAGAVAALAKPRGPLHPAWAQESRELADTVAAMSEVKVVRRRLPRSAGAVDRTAPPMGRGTPQDVRLVAIGSSTGGPPVLETILSSMPGDYPVPIVVVQHIAHGFLEGLVEWLNARSALEVVVARDGAKLAPGVVYFAPTGRHMAVTGSVIRLSDGPLEFGTRPSVAHLFRSVAATYRANAVGVLLTGMGRDGAAELKHMRDAGAATIIQNRETAVIWGMPGEADRLGAAQFTLSPEGIAEKLKRIAGLWGVLTGEY